MLFSSSDSNWPAEQGRHQDVVTQLSKHVKEVISNLDVIYRAFKQQYFKYEPTISMVTYIHVII